MRRFLIAATIGLVLLPAPAFRAVAADGPRAQIKQTVDRVIATLKDETLAEKERRERLTELIRARFDFDAMSQWVLGPQWRKASAAERDKFKALFSDLLEATYLGRIESYTDQKVEFAEERTEGKKAQVDTLILTESADIPISYKLVDRAEQWLVYDVVIENVSMVRNYRSSFGEIARKEGMDGLFRQMEEKIAELQMKRDSGPRG